MGEQNDIPSKADGAPRRARRNTGAMTLRQVAQLAEVAPVTVSRVLNTPLVVSPEVRERVLAVIRDTGYVPNRLAGGLASARSNLIAAIVPTISMSVFLQTVQSLTDSLFHADYQLMLGQTGYSAEREDALLEAIIGRRPDGIVLTGIMHSPEGRRLLQASGIPVVETWDFTPNPIDMLVGLSHEQLGAAVCKHLHTKGRRRLGLLSGDDERAARRRKGFYAEAGRLGLREPALQLEKSPTSHTEGRAGLAALLAAQPDIDAVFCSSDMLALGVLTEAQARAMAVPDQLAVVGFGDIEFAQTVIPSLTTVRIDGTRMGQTAAGFIADRAEGKTVAEPVVDIGFSIMERESA